MMLVFLDTEFTNFEKPELISIGLAAIGAPDFYAERVDYPHDARLLFSAKLFLCLDASQALYAMHLNSPDV